MKTCSTSSRLVSPLRRHLLAQLHNTDAPTLSHRKEGESELQIRVQEEMVGFKKECQILLNIY